MRTFFAAIAAVLFASGIASGAEQSLSNAASCTPSAATEVIDARFGVFGANQSGQRVLIETNTLPAINGISFGWFVLFKTDKPTVVWREEFELPEAPPTWGPGETAGAFTVSPDRRIAVTERIVPTALGFFANEWRYAPGDPVGKHKMRIYVDGVLLREFEFSILPHEESEEGPKDAPNDRSGGMRGA